MSTIYERIGGAPAIEAAVDIFYNKVISDSRINHWFAHMDMKAQRKKQEIFLTMAFGGPSNYTGRDMANAHKKLVEHGLCDADFDAVAENLQNTLIELKVPQDIIDDAMALLESQRDVVLCRQSQHEIVHSSPVSADDLQRDGYKQFTLLERAREVGCEDKYFRLTFKPHDQFTFQPGNHMQLIAEIDGKWIQRSYTPMNDPDSNSLELLVKHYPNGIMSRYLSTIPVETKVWMKGPNGHFVYRSGIASKINMFACGSGITPMWQILKAVARNPEDKTEIVLIHGCHDESELAMRKELNELVAKHSNIRISQTLSLPHEDWNGMKGRISEENIAQFNSFNPDANTINLLCGTDRKSVV